MKKFLVALTVLLGISTAALFGVSLYAAAQAATPVLPPPAPVTSPVGSPATLEDTAGMIVFEINKAPQVIVFVSKTGEMLAVQYAKCAKTPACVALANAVHEAGHVEMIDIESGASNGGTAI